MPTYEYACKSCGAHIEVVQAFTDNALTECATCGGDLRKVFGSIGISFKGSGFYKNDSRSSASKTSASPSSTDNSPSSDSSKKSDTKADSAPAKSETKSEKKSSGSDAKAS